MPTRPIRCVAALALALVSMTGVVHAQAQRSFLNGGFEGTALTAADNAVGCYVQVSDPQVPGWTTNHPVGVGTGSCTSPAPISNAQLIELWRTNFSGVVARENLNFAELNAETASRMSQSVCLAQGEQVRYQISHRARVGTDVASFNVDTIANQVVRMSTTTTGAGTVVAGSCGGGSVTGATCNAPVTTNTWADYTGSFTWNGTSGVHNLGFEAISAGSGSVTIGNFLDRVQIFLSPFVEFGAATGTGRESVATPASFALVVNGAVTTPVNVTVAVSNTGTATLGSDFTTPGGAATFTVTIPVGNYDGTASRFPLGIAVVDDGVIENNETIVLDLVANPAAYAISGTQTCGTAATARSTYTITDNDVDVRTTKTVGNATPQPGGTTQFTVTYANNTARPTLGDTTAHDAVAAISDPQPAGMTFTAWTCTASGGATCPAASGSNGITGNATLPAGTGGAAGGVLTYLVTATLNAGTCTAVTNTSTITALAPVAEGTSAQAGFATPAPGGTANNTASATVTPACADLAVTKTNNVSQVSSGSTVNYTIVVANNGPIAADGALVRDPAQTGLACTTASCAAAGGAACPATTGAALVTALQSAGGVAIPTLPNAGSATFTLTCTVQ